MPKNVKRPSYETPKAIQKIFLAKIHNTPFTPRQLSEHIIFLWSTIKSEYTYLKGF